MPLGGDHLQCLPLIPLFLTLPLLSSPPPACRSVSFLSARYVLYSFSRSVLSSLPVVILSLCPFLYPLPLSRSLALLLSPQIGLSFSPVIIWLSS